MNPSASVPITHSTRTVGLAGFALLAVLCLLHIGARGAESPVSIANSRVVYTGFSFGGSAEILHAASTYSEKFNGVQDQTGNYSYTKTSATKGVISYLTANNPSGNLQTDTITITVLTDFTGTWVNADLSESGTFTASAVADVTTSAATSITTSGATLNATLNPNNDTTTAQFQYGTTTSYGSTATITLSPNNGILDQNVSVAVSGLAANTLYHFRAVATNAAGGTVGGDLTFTTSAAATAPSITANPRSQSVAVGGSATLSVSATGSGTLTYQWFKDGVAINGATANTLPRANATAADTGFYQVEVTNAGGSSRSDGALFVVLPDGGTPFTGSDNFDNAHDPARWASTNFGLAGSHVRTAGRLEFRKSGLEDAGGVWAWSGLAPYGQDWEARVTGNLPALSFTADGYVGLGLYVLNSADPGDQAGLELETGRAGGNGYRQFTSLFSVNDVDMPAQDVAAQTTSTRATFRVRWVAATARLHWEYDADGPANGEVWTLLRTFDPAATWGMSSGPFLIGIGGFSENRIITSGDGVSLDDFAASTAAPAPTINTQPQSQVVTATSNVTFTVTATGSALTYQWRKGAVDIGGATSDTLTLNSVTRAASGAYSVVVTSGGSSTPSSAATLRVIVPQQLQPPQRAGGGQFQLFFADPDNAVGGDLSRFEVHHTANFLGASTVWVTNSGSFTLSNGKILFDDAGSTSAPRRYYRVIEK